MLGRYSFALAISTIVAPPLAAASLPNPYSGEELRRIKALSDDDLKALRAGEGMGLAKAAELNGYPGPAHVRALRQQLQLTPEQFERITVLFEKMSVSAKSIGRELISREEALDQLFAKQEITHEKLKQELEAIAELKGRLRGVHLAAHLETRPILQPDQLLLYERLRGYGSRGSHHRPK